MAKHLIDLDESALEAARARLGTETIKATVNRALSLAATDRGDEIADALDGLAAVAFDDRADSWR